MSLELGHLTKDGWHRAEHGHQHGATDEPSHGQRCVPPVTLRAILHGNLVELRRLEKPAGRKFWVPLRLLLLDEYSGGGYKPQNPAQHSYTQRGA